VSSIATDLGNTAIYSSIVFGGALHIFSKESVSNIEYLHEYFNSHQIDCLKIVPSHWKALSSGENLLLPHQLLIFGGEALSSELIEQMRISGAACSVVNHYGPTETTVGKLLHQVDKEKKYHKTVPIGKPFSNSQVYVLSKDMELCPVGIPGQLYISGDGIARGYLNNVQLADQKFINNRFNRRDTHAMYATGDLVRWLWDGNIEFIGRADDQVKIRGYRVELGEIESLLLQSGFVAHAVVLAKEDQDGNKRLVAYTVGIADYDKESMVHYIRERLPDYMIPTQWVELESFPMLPNGKVDRKSLPEPGETEQLASQYIAPRNEIESRLAALWKDVLEADQVGVHDDFFELGGHSLLAVRLISAIRKEFVVEMPIGDIFDYPTVAQLAGQVARSSGKAVLPSAVAVQSRPEFIPLSFSQERLWFIDQLEGSVQYHVPAVMRLKGSLNREALELTLRTIISRHEVLRTVIIASNGKPFQKIQDIDGWSMSFNDDSTYSNDQKRLQEYIKQFIKKPFDLSKDYLLRAELIKLSHDDHIIVVTMHHIASDAWSTPILVKEVVELYNSFEEGRLAQLPTLAIQYADYSIWQRNYLQGETLDRKLNYWRTKLEGATPLQLPVDFARPVIQTNRGKAISYNIDKEISDKILTLTQQQGATLFMTLLAAFDILLHRYSGQQDIVVGTSIANRTQKDVEGLVGFFVNTLALRTQVDPEVSFIDLLQQVKQNTIEAYNHQDVPFEKVVEAVVRERDLNRSPLFQAMLDLQNAPSAPELKLGRTTLSAVPYELGTAKFDITFFVHESAHGLQGSVQYRTDLFLDETINRMINHFKELLRSISEAPQQKIGALQLVTEQERQQLLDDFNNTAKDYEFNKTIVDLFEEQVEKTPDNVAVVFEDQQLTYKELNEQANQLAGYLRSKGVKEETLVPICVERSLEMLVYILAILKAGAAYVPIDPEYPADRINYLLEDTGAAIVLSSRKSFSRLPDMIDADVIIPEDDWSVISLYPPANNNLNITPSYLAYVIYTSGSTGKPKGVMIEHQNLLSYLLNNKTRYINPDTSNSGSFVHLSYTFDASLTAMFMPLLFGKSIVIGSKQSINIFEDPNLQKYAPYDFIKITPSHLELLQPKMRTDYGSLLTRKLVIGGEALLLSHLNSFVEEGIDVEIINEYGPTEATVGCSVYSFKTLQNTRQSKNDVSIGKPIDNVQMYILDRHLNLLPPGVPGEIFIAGAGVARGYLNRAELSAEKFLPNPFNDKWDARMYRTGDIGRWLPDGNIQYLGRQDDQVKIRGHRIELGEIESAIQQNDQIRQAVVLAKDDTGGNRKLVAYVVPDQEFDRDSMIAYLEDHLPEYMVPALWVSLEAFPLTTNGKIDRKALPDPEAAISHSTEYVAPRNEIEQRLAEIWQELLEVDRIGVHDSFFELGGHSLLTVRLISVIRKEFKVEMPISTIFDYSTVALLAAHLGSLSDEDVLPPVDAVKSRPQRIPLSFSQERLWFIDQLEGTLQYHVPTVLRLNGSLDRKALNDALRTLVNRHEVLRTVIREQEGKPYQLIMDKDQWQLAFVDGSEYHDETKLQRFIKQLQTAPFDLSKDHVIRGHLIGFSAEDHVLVVTLHHIASDGWSRSVLVKELLELYNATIEKREPVLPALSIQYADYAIWQRKLFDGDNYEKKLTYWKNKLKEPTTLELPTDHPRPAVWSTRGATVNFTFDKELGEKVHELSRQKGATLFMTLLAAFKVLVYRYSGQQDILIGSAIAGRQQQELENLIGFFVNTLAFRTELSPDDPFTEFLQEVKKTTIEAYAHQEVPFEKVVDAVLNQRSLSKNPLVHVMFALLNTPEVPELRLGDIKLSNEGHEHASARFDITFFLNETPQGLTGSVEYATDLYNEDTIVRMIGHYKELLNNIVRSPEKKISSLSILTEPERKQLLVEFNQTILPLQREKTLVDLFEIAVCNMPDALALASGAERLTYKELNERSNQLAHHLLGIGVTKETFIPICIERSINLLIGFLGIMKAGAAYVPIDPKYPEDRIRFMLEDTDADILISVDSIIPKLPARKSMKIISLDGDQHLIGQQPVNNPNIELLPTSLVNIIYTSGSTGRPKGVMVEHKGMINMSGWYNHAFGVSSQSRFTTMTGVGFDAFGFEIWPCLTIGAALFIVDDDIRLDTSKLIDFVSENAITHCLVPTALIQQFVSISKDTSLSLQYLLCGGDKLAAVDIDGLSYKVVNNYGPTEYSIVATSYELKKKNNLISPAIGPPVANTTIYILDEQNELVPIGVAGEICLSGDSIARGYLNSDDLTSEKFVTDPFTKEPGRKMYRTGDIGRWLSDGNIEYIRRKDDQVKIRGHRIELGEIENVFQQT
ncbi:MAG TPA: amino acid adenylation domain-containing protein, partial [Flavitalea sp.]|nr:amino acid adenylation domain-containing protein [Flavitalea sp.]